MFEHPVFTKGIHDTETHFEQVKYFLGKTKDGGNTVNLLWIQLPSKHSYPPKSSRDYVWNIVAPKRLKLQLLEVKVDNFLR